MSHLIYHYVALIEYGCEIRRIKISCDIRTARVFKVIICTIMHAVTRGIDHVSDPITNPVTFSVELCEYAGFDFIDISIEKILHAVLCSTTRGRWKNMSCSNFKSMSVNPNIISHI